MAAKPKTADVKREFVVLRAVRRGFNCFTTFYGPFTKAEASAYAMHENTYGNAEYTVEQVLPMPHHDKWILREVNA